MPKKKKCYTIGSLINCTSPQLPKEVSPTESKICTLSPIQDLALWGEDGASQCDTSKSIPATS